MRRNRGFSFVLVAAAVGLFAVACGGKSPTVSAPSPTAAKLTMSSTLAKLTQLPQRVSWEVRTNAKEADVSAVDFLIDNVLAWSEHHAPYVFGNDGNVLVTTFLKAGTHMFTSRVTSAAGKQASEKVTATVGSAPRPPSRLVGTWARTVGDFAGWKITVDPIGWLFDDPDGGGQDQDVAYPAAGQVDVKASIEQPPLGTFKRGGAFCEEPDPTARYTWTVRGQTLTLRAVGKDGCPGREEMLNGAWTRSTR